MCCFLRHFFKIWILKVSHLDRCFPQDGILLSVRLTDTEHPQVLRSVHLQRQLLLDRQKG